MIEQITTRRQPAGPQSAAARRVNSGGAGLLTLASIAFALQFYRTVGLLLYNEQFLAAMLGPGSRSSSDAAGAPGDGRRAVPSYDWLLAAASVAVGCYVAVRYPVLSEAYDAADRRPDRRLITVPLVVEALRRTVGMALAIVVWSS